MNSYVENNILFLQFPDKLNRSFLTDFEEFRAEALETNAEYVVFDFRQTTFMDRNAYRSIIMLTKDFGLKKVVSTNLNRDLHAQIKSDGMEKALNVVSEIGSAKKTAVKSKKGSNVDVRMVNPFLLASASTIEQLTKVPCKTKAPRVISKKQRDPADLTGVISISTKAFEGKIMLAFGQDVILEIYRKMMGEAPEGLDEDVRDAVSEILNIIYGQAKKELNEQFGFEMQMKFPEAHVGSYPLDDHPGEHVLVLPFQSELGDFAMEIFWAS